MKTAALLTLAAALLTLAPLADAMPGPLLDKPAAAEADQLFDKLFGGEEKERRDYWDAEARALCASGYSRNEANKQIYAEHIQQLSADGMELRTYRRVRFLGGTRFVNHTCKVEHAVYPCIFAEPLRLIVERAEECVFFHHWQMDADNRELLRVHVKQFNLDKAAVIHEYTQYERK